MTVDIDDKYYGPESSTSEIEALRGRVVKLDHDVFLWREVPKPSVFQIGVFGSKLDELVADVDAFYLISDLTEAERPNAEVRRAITDVMSRHRKLVHTACFLGRNLVLRVALRFVFAQGGWNNWSVCKDLDECLAAIAEVKRKREVI